MDLSNLGILMIVVNLGILICRYGGSGEYGVSSKSSDPPDPPDSTDPSKSSHVNRISKFIRFTISVRSNRFVQITEITGIQQVLNNCSSLISVCGFVITTLEGLKEYNDFNNVTMAHEDDT